MIGLVGSSGFIGRTVLERAVAKGVPMRAFARSGPETGGYDHGVPILRYSLTDAYFPALFAGLHTLVLTASATRPNTPANSPAHEWLANVAPHLALFESLLDSDVSHIVYLSSGGAIYGDRATPEPIPETAPSRPADPYGYGKLSIEAALPVIWKGQGKGGRRRFSILRPSNPIGRHQLGSVGAHGLVTTVLHHLRNGLPISVQGDGQAVRDYFSADDLADLVLAVVRSDPGLENVTVNAGSGIGLSILDVIERCAAYLGTQPDIRMNPGVQPAVRCNVLDTALAQSLFGWRARTTFADCLRQLDAALSARDAARSQGE